MTQKGFTRMIHDYLRYLSKKEKSFSHASTKNFFCLCSNLALVWILFNEQNLMISLDVCQIPLYTVNIKQEMSL